MNQAHPALDERLRTSQPGQLLEPFRIEDRWLVPGLERYEAARFDEGTAQRMAQNFSAGFKRKLGKICRLT